MSKENEMIVSNKHKATDLLQCGLSPIERVLLVSYANLQPFPVSDTPIQQHSILIDYSLHA